MIDQAQKLRELVRDKPVGSAGEDGAGSPVKSKRCRSVAVLSGKGGVGKSSVAIALGMALSRLHKKTLVFDGDLGLANVHILLGMNPKFNLSHVIAGECDLHEVITQGPGDIAILPGASGVEQMANLDVGRLELIRRKLERVEGEYDFIIIDAGAGIADTTMRLCAPADIALVIATPEPTSLTDAYASIKVMLSREHRSGDRVHLAINLARDEREGREIARKLQSLVRNFLGTRIKLGAILPAERSMPAMIRAQKSLFLEKPSSPFVLRVQAYARMLCGLEPQHTRGFFAGLLRR